jgi:aclacinomycin oxidase
VNSDKPSNFNASLVKVDRGDPRYAELAGRGSRRFAGNPDHVYVVQSTEQVVTAVQAAVKEERRLAVRSGGHCFEAFVSAPDVRVVIDMSMMNDVYFDPQRHAFAVEAGARLGEAYRKLFLGWDVTIPAGVAANVGVGGHVVGGAFGFLCRKHGLAADHLYAVEVVVVDESGVAKAVVATREPSDPNRELWWAHTGGGGGNFGVVTRYWFRSPGADDETEPSRLLPAAPATVLTFKAEWSWEHFDERAFVRLGRNYGAWCELNSDVDAPGCDLYSSLFLYRKQLGKIELRGIALGAVDDGLFAEHLAAINDGVGVHGTHEAQRRTWLSHVFNPFPGIPMGEEDATFKLKDALLRKRYSDAQLAVAYQHLTRTDVDLAGGSLGMTTYGGQTNAVAPDATASFHRDAILTTSCSAGWVDPHDEGKCLEWVRRFYAELFASTGGVPFGKAAAGALVNHADADLADPALNTSGVPFSAIYYGENYPRLQRIKSRWDPLNVFRHALSIR